MNDTNPLAEAKATLVLSDLNRRKRLLKIIRGKPEWIYNASGVLWIIVILYILRMEKAYDNMALFVLMPIGLGIVGVYVGLSRRMNALIELIGEDKLGKPKTGDKEQTA